MRTEENQKQKKREQVLKGLAEAKGEIEKLEALVRNSEVDFERISLVLGITEPLDEEHGTWGSSFVGLAGDLSLNVGYLVQALKESIEKMETGAEEPSAGEPRAKDPQRRAQELGLAIIEGGLNGKPTIH